MKDPYQTLGVARGASQDEIKKAYRKLARSLHPDLNPGNKQAEDRFKEISAAYDLLSDPEKRGKFDRGEIDASGAEKPRWGWRAHAEGAAAGKYREAGGFGFDPDDILSELFGRRRGAAAGETVRVHGADQHYALRVPFVEALLGATKRITLPTGKSLDVRVPPGTEDGRTLRLKAQGSPGTGGGRAGDAYIEIKVEPHPFFSREGNDILLELPVTLPEAVLGAKVTVPTVDGKVALTIPPGSNTGSTLRLRGKGVPHGQARGDQLVRLKVMLPDRPDRELEEFLRDWAPRHGYDVRTKAGMT